MVAANRSALLSRVIRTCTVLSLVLVGWLAVHLASQFFHFALGTLPPPRPRFPELRGVDGQAIRCGRLLRVDPRDEQMFDLWLLRQARPSRASELFEQRLLGEVAGVTSLQALAGVEKLARSGDIDAMRCLGIGTGELHWLECAAQHDVISGYALSHRIRRSERIDDRLRAFELLRHSAEEGFAAAQFEMALLYDDPGPEASLLRQQWHIARDPRIADQWLRLSQSQSAAYSFLIGLLASFPTIR